MARNGRPPRAATAAAPLEISVTNFGPISRGTFRIAPMTIFVGPNNSGKTYAALLAHSVLSCISAGPNPRRLAAMVDEQRKSPGFQRLVSDMESLAASAGSARVRIPPRLSGQVCDLVNAFFARELASAIEGNIGLGLADLVRVGAKSSKIHISGTVTASLTLRKRGTPIVDLDLPARQYALANRAGQIAAYERKTGDGLRDVRYYDSSIDDRVASALDDLGMTENLGMRAVMALFATIGRPYLSRPARSYYLPAARSGILALYNMLLSNIVDSTNHKERDRDTSIASVMSDFVKFFHNVAAQNGKNRKNGKTAVEDLFGGSLVLSKPRLGPTLISYKFDGTEIPIKCASSGIAETAAIELYQSRTSSSDILVIEEPEAHLHPENQTKLARHIVRLISNGTHVILVTHGVYFLEQLSMFVRMSKISPAERKKLGFDSNDFIYDDDVAPYMFKPNPKGGYSVHELNHSADEGIWQDEFINVTASLYEKDAKINQFTDQ